MLHRWFYDDSGVGYHPLLCIPIWKRSDMCVFVFAFVLVRVCVFACIICTCSPNKHSFRGTGVIVRGQDSCGRPRTCAQELASVVSKGGRPWSLGGRTWSLGRLPWSPMVSRCLLWAKASSIWEHVFWRTNDEIMLLKKLTFWVKVIFPQKVEVC